MGGWTPGHSMRMIAGGARHNANSMAPVPIVTAAPSATPPTTTSVTAANQTWINLDRVISFSMVLTFVSRSGAVAPGPCRRRFDRPDQSTSHWAGALCPIAQRESASRGHTCAFGSRQARTPMAMATGNAGGAKMRLRASTSRDHDIHKGAMEDGRPSATTNAPGLDDNGLPNDETAIAEDVLGAREDGSQG